MSVRGFRSALVVAGFSAFSTMVSANPIATIDGNDCSGVFGQGFENCRVPVLYDENQSPIIIKFDDPNGDNTFSSFEINDSLFPSIDGSEFSFNFSGEGLIGTWAYNPGPDDPMINFFTAKFANNFTLFSNEGEANSDGWTIAQGLSHLSFYDTESGGGGEVPEPATLGLLGLGLVGLALMRRRRN